MLSEGANSSIIFGVGCAQANIVGGVGLRWLFEPVVEVDELHQVETHDDHIELAQMMQQRLNDEVAVRLQLV